MDKSTIAIIPVGATIPMEVSGVTGYTYTTPKTSLQQRPTPTADQIYQAIAHGDQEHREWLKEALDAVFAGQPVPPPRGKGTAPEGYEDHR